MIDDASITRVLLFLLDLYVVQLHVLLKPERTNLVQFNLLLVFMFWTIVMIRH